jgi:hypothetical protein
MPDPNKPVPSEWAQGWVLLHNPKRDYGAFARELGACLPVDGPGVEVLVDDQVVGRWSRAQEVLAQLRDETRAHDEPRAQ